MSLQENLHKQLEANKEHNANQGSGGDWFKFQEGDNTFRVLSEPVMIFEKFKVGICYTDCGYQGSAKLLTRIVDRADGKIKLAKIPYSKGEELLGLENDADYGFTGFPMPYDITIKAEGAGTKEVKYSAPLPRPAKPLSTEIVDELPKLKSIEEIVEKMKVKQKEKHMQDGTWQKNQEAKAKLKGEVSEARAVDGGKQDRGYDYPEADADLNDIPF